MKKVKLASSDLKGYIDSCDEQKQIIRKLISLADDMINKLDDAEMSLEDIEDFENDQGRFARSGSRKWKEIVPTAYDIYTDFVINIGSFQDDMYDLEEQIDINILEVENVLDNER